MRVAIYTRVSTERQSTEGFSLEAQHDQLLAHVNANNMQLFKIYSDPGVSAKDLKRPGVQEMIRDLKAGMFEAVIVHKLDRLTRNISDLYDLVKMVNHHNIQLISLSEKIDTYTPMGRMFVYMMGIFAQMFRENLGDEVTKGMRKRAENGLHNITVNLFGYERNEHGELLIKEDEAKWVRWIFERYAAGEGTPAIAKKLNSQGVRRNQGALWDHSKVTKTLNNKHYCGQVHWKSTRDEDQTVSEGKHEAIVSLELFERAQTIFNRRRTKMISQKDSEYIFSGIVKCGVCGASYNGMSDKRKGYPIRRYGCASRKNKGTCTQSNLPETKILEMVFQSIDLIGKEYSRKDVPKHNLNEEAELRKAIKVSEDRRERWQLAYGDGNMPYEDFARRMQEEMVKLQELEAKLSTITPQIISHITPAEAVHIINDIKDNWEHLDQGTRKEVIQSLFQEIRILKVDKTWTIKSIILA